ncbi:MAG: hypothetical protein DWQ01_07080 [Planctomycetota bacterium]|nr:MAG: hypothetical protein DWQ01_07080 [Planctomycetota bacterium]
MKSNHWKEAAEVFKKVLEAEVDSQEEVLRRLCTGNPELRQEVEALLAARVEENSFLETPLLHAIREQLEQRQLATVQGHQLRAYRLEKILGEGSMGVVFEATRENPKRTVAIKIMRQPLLAGKDPRRFFELEVQSLALLQHPNIATLYDSGFTEDGTPYLVLEKVSGRPLSEYLKDRPFSEKELLGIFLQVLDAMGHAHRRGVIHGDIKPSNIMVLDAGKASSKSLKVKVLDFGLARIFDAGQSLSRWPSKIGGIQGTLPYLSPEMISGDLAKIDTRSDVYALGVLLYQMVTGKLPIDVGNLSLPAGARAICEQTPMDPRGFNSQLSKDLSLIIMKAIEKDPDRRYQAVSNFLEDLMRYREGRTILARPASRIYLLRKFVWRHRLTSTLVATLVIASCLYLISYFNYMRQIQTIQAAEIDSYSRTAEAARLFQIAMDFARRGAPKEEVVQALDQCLVTDPNYAAGYYQRAEFTKPSWVELVQPDDEREIRERMERSIQDYWAAHYASGGEYESISKANQAWMAVEHLAQFRGEGSGMPRALVQIANLLTFGSRLLGGDTSMQRAEDLLLRVKRLDPSDSYARAVKFSLLVRTYQRQQALALMEGTPAGSEFWLLKEVWASVGLLRERMYLAPGESANPDASPRLAAEAWKRALELEPSMPLFHLNYGRSIRESGLHNAVAEAWKSCKTAVALAPDLIQARINFAYLMREVGDLPGACRELKWVLGRLPNLHGARNSLIEWQTSLGNFEAALEELEVACRKDPKELSYWSSRVQILGMVDRREEAISVAKECGKHFSQSAGAHYLLGKALWDDEKYSEGEAAFQEALALKPGFAPVGVEQARRMEMEEKLLEAKQRIQDQLAVTPSDPFVLVYAVAFSDRRFPEESVGYWSVLVEPEREWHEWLAIAREFQAEENFGRQIQILNQARSRAEKFYLELYLPLGEALLFCPEKNFRDYALAEEVLHFAQAKSGWILAKDLYARALTHLGKHQEALDYWKEVRSFRPDDPEVLAYSAICEAVLGLDDQANFDRFRSLALVADQEKARIRLTEIYQELESGLDKVPWQ